MKPTTCFVRTAIAGGLIVGLAACAGPGPRPDSQLQTARSSIQQAEANNARKYEPVMLNQARNEIADASDLMDKKQYKEARRLLEQAAVDAQLASARSETQKARSAVDEINRTIKSLQAKLQEAQ